QGTAYLLSGPHPTSMMRHWRVGSIEPLPGLDPEILALYGPDEPARLEQASHEAAGPAYAKRNDREAMAALCAVVQHEATQATTRTAARTTAAAGDDDDALAAPPPVLEDRVLAALADAEEPMTAQDLLDVVNADGGREVKLGSIRNTLKGLTTG